MKEKKYAKTIDACLLWPNVFDALKCCNGAKNAAKVEMCEAKASEEQMFRNMENAVQTLLCAVEFADAYHVNTTLV